MTCKCSVMGNWKQLQCCAVLGWGQCTVAVYLTSRSLVLASIKQRGGGGWSLVFIAPRTKVCTKHEPRHPQCSPLNKCKYAGHTPWNNGKSGAKLVLTSSTTPGLQIRVIGCHVAMPRSHWSAVPTPLFIYISQLLRDSFSVSQQPPIWDPPSHYSMAI